MVLSSAAAIALLEPFHPGGIVLIIAGIRPRAIAPKITAALMPALGSIRPIFSPGWLYFFQNAGDKQGFGQQLCDRYPAGS